VCPPAPTQLPTLLAPSPETRAAHTPRTRWWVVWASCVDPQRDGRALVSPVCSHQGPGRPPRTHGVPPGVAGEAGRSVGAADAREGNGEVFSKCVVC